MSDELTKGILDAEEEFDPLYADDLVIDQEDMDDDNPLDTVDYPTMRNMPEHMQREAVYTPATTGSADVALRSMIDHNPGRRPVLLAILGMCENGAKSSEITAAVDDMQQHNRSVYSGITLCHMLERAGGLEMEQVEVAEEKVSNEEGVEYLEIKERVDPEWTSTADGMAVYNDLTSGSLFRDIVLDRDVKYLEVYEAVLSAVNEQPRSLDEINTLVDSFEVVMSPRRFGGHFIDMLEKTDAMEWKNNAWTITELGKKMLGQMKAGE